MIVINMQYFGNKGSSSGKSGAGGVATMTEEERAAIVNDVEKAIEAMKSPTFQHSSILKIHGLEVVVTKEAPYGGGKPFFSISIWDGNNEIYNVARDSWSQAKDTLYTRAPSMAVTKARGKKL